MYTGYRHTTRCEVDPQEEVPETEAEGHLDEAMKG